MYLFTSYLSWYIYTCSVETEMKKSVVTVINTEVHWRVLRMRMGELSPICLVTANILNKHSQTADKGWSSRLGFGRGTNNSSLWKRILLRHSPRIILGPGLILWYELCSGKDMRFGTWNFRSLYRAGSLTAATRELVWYKLDLVGVEGIRWDNEDNVRAGV